MCQAVHLKAIRPSSGEEEEEKTMKNDGLLRYFYSLYLEGGQQPVFSTGLYSACVTCEA